ncbi:PfkB family carbohydrate kinase [Microbacterium sp. 179-I 3D2 NHS]|uniref:PfkB family carbohydrate kinase n=1 Tax=Microbacterium sp. 179-I 3D2 NHS TaxID=3235178 RepID=UPI0039A33490
MTPTRIDRLVVFGQIAQDLALAVDELPAVGASADVGEARWLLGGKGANQAVGLRQLGAGVAAVGVVGDDAIGAAMIAALEHDGVDVAGVVRRGATSVLLDVVDPDADRMLFEHTPASALLTPDDVERAARSVREADTVCLQAQQPGDALLVAARLARRSGSLVALDGAPDATFAEELVSCAHIVRADAAEAEMLVGFALSDVAAGREACRLLRERGPSVVAVQVKGEGDLVASTAGTTFRPYGQHETVVDRTGGGDAFFAGLVRGTGLGWSLERTADLAARAAASVVARLGGRPDLGGMIAD